MTVPSHKHKTPFVHVHVGLCLMSIMSLLLFDAIVLPSPSHATASFVQSATGTKKSDEVTPTSVSATFGGGATAGNLLIAVLGAGGNVTLNAPSGFLTAINENATVSQAIFFQIASGGETIITATVSSNPSSIGLHIYEYSGSSATVSDFGSTFGFSGGPSSGSVTTTATDELLFAAFTSENNTNHNNGSWDNGSEDFTEREDFNTTGVGTSNTFAGGDNITNSPDPHTVSTNLGGGNTNWRGQIVSFAPPDMTDPSVNNVTSATANGTYCTGAVISIQVKFDEIVFVTGTPQLTLETGTTDAVVDYASGSGTDTLTFAYTVVAGHSSPDLDYFSTTALDLNGGTIEDSSSNPADIILATPGAANSLGFNKALVIDTPCSPPETTDPTVNNVTSSTFNSTYCTGAVISVQVEFDEVVFVTGTPQLTLETGTTNALANYTSGSGTNTLTFTYTVANGHSTLDLDYTSTLALSLNGGTIKDAADNNANLTLASPSAAGSLGANKNIIIETPCDGDDGDGDSGSIHHHHRHRQSRTSVTTIVGCTRANALVPFIDILYSFAILDIENFYRRCIVDGRTPYLFQPNEGTTKAEYLKIVFNTYQLGTAPWEPVFADVGPDHGLAPFVIQAAKLGYINSGGFFYPDQNITRAEAFKILALVKGVRSGSLEAHFADIYPGDWFYNYVAWAQNQGLAVGYHMFFDKSGPVSDFYSFPALLYKAGDTSIDVLHYKEVFAQLGYFYGEINEFFDAELVAGVSAYQTVKGITPNTGQIGAQTRTMLLSEILVPREENWFRPDKPITRAEITKIVHLSEGL